MEGQIRSIQVVLRRIAMQIRASSKYLLNFRYRLLQAGITDVLAVVLSSLAIASSSTRLQAGDTDGTADNGKCVDVAETLKGIRTAGIVASPGADKGYETVMALANTESYLSINSHWSQVYRQVRQDFEKLVRVEPRQRRLNLRCYLAEFGRHGPQADFSAGTGLL